MKRLIFVFVSIGSLLVVFSASAGDLEKKLFYAAYNGNVNEVTKLLDNGADINLRTGTAGVTPLMVATQNGHLSAAKVLIDKGANVNIKSGTRDITALYIASTQGNLEIVNELLNNGADVNAKCDDFGATALIAATVKGHSEIVKALIDKGADINIKTNKGWTALEAASYKGYTEIAEILANTGTPAKAAVPSKEVNVYGIVELDLKNLTLNADNVVMTSKTEIVSGKYVTALNSKGPYATFIPKKIIFKRGIPVVECEGGYMFSVRFNQGNFEFYPIVQNVKSIKNLSLTNLAADFEKSPSLETMHKIQQIKITKEVDDFIAKFGKLDTKEQNKSLDFATYVVHPSLENLLKKIQKEAKNPNRAKVKTIMEKK